MIVKRLPGESTTYETRSESYSEIDKNKRYKQILSILSDNKEPMTAKEIAVEMYKRGYTPTSERNFASPRLTEMLKDGSVDVYGKKRCKFTHKNVTVYVIRKRDRNESI